MASGDSTSDRSRTPCTLEEPRVRAVLDRLFREAGRQVPSLGRLAAASLGDAILRRGPSLAREVQRLKHLYVPVSPKQGRLLYLVARSVGAKRVVEFGTSFGVSTLHLAAAVRDNGGGRVIGSELEPSKAATARRNLEEAGLADLVEIREGDAQQTLRDPGGSVDMAFLDGHAPLYLPILRLLEPHLRRGAAVLADNVFTFRKAVAPYVGYVQDPANGYASLTLYLKDGTEYSLRL